MVAKFYLGKVFVSKGILEKISRTDIINALKRHASGDWRVVSKNDWDANNKALEKNERLLSSYIASNGTKFWIITESDRSRTTVLLPDEY